MPGPNNPQEALSWIKEAVREGRTKRTQHLFDRMKSRSVVRLDVNAAVRRATRIEPYGAPPEHGGTCWRIHGKDEDGRALAVGVEAYLDEAQRWAVLITVICTEKGRS